MTADSATPEVRRSRGDRQREAIVTAVRELLEQRSFGDLSVSKISDRAGITRSGFYFYFDSKYAVLAVILAEFLEELDELTHGFAPRGADESPALFAKRMVGGATAVFASNHPVMRACNAAQNTDAQIREMMNDVEDAIIDKIVGVIEQDSGARPISSDLTALVRTLTVDDRDDAVGRQWLRRARRGSPARPRHRGAVVADRTVGRMSAASPVVCPAWRGAIPLRARGAF